jgi:membrane protein
MPPPIDSPSYDHLTIQESTGVARTQSSPSGLAAVSYSSAGEWIRATCIAKALKRGLTVVLLMMIFSALISASISLVVKSAHTNYVYAGAIQLILGGISLGFVGPSTERALLFAGATSRTIWRIIMVYACAITTLIAISMGVFAILDLVTGHVRVVDVYMIQHTGIGPYLWLLVPLGAFPGFLASACVSMASRYLGSWSTATVIALTVLLMNPISFLIIPHALRTGLPGYIVYLLAAALVYPFLLRFILTRPRNEK